MHYTNETSVSSKVSKRKETWNLNDNLMKIIEIHVQL